MTKKFVFWTWLTLNAIVSCVCLPTCGSFVSVSLQLAASRIYSKKRGVKFANTNQKRWGTFRQGVVGPASFICSRAVLSPDQYYIFLPWLLSAPSTITAGIMYHASYVNCFWKMRALNDENATWQDNAGRRKDQQVYIILPQFGALFNSLIVAKICAEAKVS